MGRMLTPAEAAEKMRISVPALHQLNFHRIGPPRIAISARRFVYDEDTLEAWLAAREAPAGERISA